MRTLQQEYENMVSVKHIVDSVKLQAPTSPVV